MIYIQLNSAETDCCMIRKFIYYRLTRCRVPFAGGVNLNYQIAPICKIIGNFRPEMTLCFYQLRKEKMELQSNKYSQKGSFRWYSNFAGGISFFRYTVAYAGTVSSKSKRYFG